VENYDAVSLWEFAERLLPEETDRYIARGEELKSARRDLACIEAAHEHRHTSARNFVPMRSDCRMGTPGNDWVLALGGPHTSAAHDARQTIAHLTALRDAERALLCHKVATAICRGRLCLTWTDSHGRFVEFHTGDLAYIDIDFENMTIELGPSAGCDGAKALRDETRLIEIPNVLVRVPKCRDLNIREASFR